MKAGLTLAFDLALRLLPKLQLHLSTLRFDSKGLTSAQQDPQTAPKSYKHCIKLRKPN